MHLYVRQLVALLFFRDSLHPAIRAFWQANRVNMLPNLLVFSSFNERPFLVALMQEIYASVSFLTIRFYTEHLYSISRRNICKEFISTLLTPALYSSL